MVHRIRLREPWKVQSTDSLTTLGFSRSFNRPTGVEPSQAIVLDIATDPAAEHHFVLRTVKLNDDLLADTASTPGHFRAHVASHLRPFNTLELEFERIAEVDSNLSLAGHPVAAVDSDIPKLTAIADVAIEIDDVP